MIGFLFGFLMSLQSSQPAVTTIASDGMSNVGKATQMVARNETEWAALWKAHAGEARPAPKVDFDTSMVVAVFLGSRPSAGFSVRITGTRPQEQALVVEFEEKRPGRGDITAQVLTSPAAIASIPKFAGEIRFEKKPSP
jgi:hypothetical protein